mmetsp:Transcript_70018/g.102582  ORF Transcript_70018/g.102582 Transcript_70018/m.102582 type:complete len:120 (+) Transcript_70018:385-744(+)
MQENRHGSQVPSHQVSETESRDFTMGCRFNRVYMPMRMERFVVHCSVSSMPKIRLTMRETQSKTEMKTIIYMKAMIRWKHGSKRYFTIQKRHTYCPKVPMPVDQQVLLPIELQVSVQAR